jgi:hypothetical protein
VLKNYEIFIPTRDSSRWISHILYFYKKHGLSPLFIVDARTIDDTRALISDAGFSYLEYMPRGDFPEAGMIEFGAANCRTNWVLRLDDDEFPSQNLLIWIEEVGSKSRNQCWFIPRKEVYERDNEILYSLSIGKFPLPKFPSQLHPMARLFNKKCVVFKEEVHTTGFEELLLFNFSPSESFIVHFNCLIRSMSERLNKIKYYEKIKPNLAWELADEYLPELFSDEFHNTGRKDLEEFKDNFAQILLTRPPSDAISEEDRLRAIHYSKVRAHKILRNRIPYRTNRIQPNYRLFDADDVAWIEKIPLILQKPIVKFICSLLCSSRSQYGSALWNYLKLKSFLDSTSKRDRFD